MRKEPEFNCNEGEEGFIVGKAIGQLMVLHAKCVVEKDILLFSADATAIEGTRAMKGSKHGSAAIGDHPHSEGIVTEWNILSKVVVVGLDLEKVTLGES